MVSNASSASREGLYSFIDFTNASLKRFSSSLKVASAARTEEARAVRREISIWWCAFLSILGGTISATGRGASENRRLAVVNPGTPMVVLEGTVSDD